MLNEKESQKEIQVKYAGALGDVRNAPTHLFELSIAHHFLSFGYQIRWIEEAGRGIAEFIVVTPALEFEVECKHISVDSGRHISRQDFSRLGALIVGQLRQRRVMGSVRITLNGRLPKASSDLDQMASAFAADVDAGTRAGQYEYAPWGMAVLDLRPADDVAIDWEATQAQLRSSMPHQAHAIVAAEPLNDRPVNPIFFTLEATKQDEYLRAIY